MDFWGFFSLPFTVFPPLFYFFFLLFFSSVLVKSISNLVVCSLFFPPFFSISSSFLFDRGLAAAFPPTHQLQSAEKKKTTPPLVIFLSKGINNIRNRDQNLPDSLCRYAYTPKGRRKKYKQALVCIGGLINKSSCVCKV